jgi:hypothetical protein
MIGQRGGRCQQRGLRQQMFNVQMFNAQLLTAPLWPWFAGQNGIKRSNAGKRDFSPISSGCGNWTLSPPWRKH